MGNGQQHSKFQGIPVASRINLPSRQRRVCRLYQAQPLLIYHSQHPKKNTSMAAALFCQMPPRNFPRRNWHLQVAERASGTKAGKIIPLLFQFCLCLSLSLFSLLRCLPSLPHTHLLANGIALYSRKFVRGDSFVRRARPDPTWRRRRRRTRARGELWPARGRGSKSERRSGCPLSRPSHPNCTRSQSLVCTDNLPLTLL